MDSELKIRISGDVEALKTSLNSGARDVKQFSDGAKATLESLDKELRVINGNAEIFGNTLQSDVAKVRAYQSAINGLLRNGVSPTSPEVLKLADNIDELNKSMSNAGKQITNTSGVAIEFSRIIQDAPYGIIGVGNNITQLTQSFSQLRQQTGSTSKALSIAFSSMFSGANLLVLAVSAITTGFTLYNVWARKNKQDTDALADSTQNYIDTLKGVERTRAEGEQSAQRDITNLRLLYEATQDHTLSMEDRYAAAQELIDQYPKQFEGLSTERILAGEAATAYDQLTQSLIATAQAMANVDRIRDNSNKILENRLEIIKLQNEANELGLEIEKERANQVAVGAAGPSGVDASAIQQQATISQLESQREAIMNRINELGGEMGDLTSENIQLQREYNSLISEGADLSGQVSTNLEKAGKKTKEQSDKLAEALIKNEENVQVAIRQGREKEIEQARIKYENLKELAKGNADALIQIENQQAAELDAINTKWDENDKERMRKKEAWMLAELDRQNAEIDKANQQAADKRKRDEEKLLADLERQNRRYARMLSNELAGALEGFLLRGENVFEALADAFKKMVVRMIAESAALKTMDLLGLSTGGGSKGGGFWNFLGNIGGFVKNLFGGGGLGFNSGAFPTGNFGGGNFPASNPMRGGFSPGIMASSAIPVNVMVSGKISGNDLQVVGNRASRFNQRFNGGQ